MKLTFKIISVMLSLLMLATSLLACGDQSKDDTTLPLDTTEPPVTTEPLNERELVEDSVPDDLNFSGIENNVITIFSRDNLEILKYEMCSEELMNDTLYDAIHYRNIDVETRLGVKIRQITQNAAWGANANAWFEVLSTAVNTNTDDFDAAAIYAGVGAPYALQNLYSDLLDYSVQRGEGYIDLEKPWWNQSLVENLNLYDNLFFLSGDLCVSGVFGIQIVRFNKDLFNERFPEEKVDVLYELVNSGKWTIGRMTDYVSQVWDDVNSNGKIDDGDTIGFKWWQVTDVAQCDAWGYALGVSMMERDQYGEYHIASFGAQMIPAYELFVKLYKSEGSMISQKNKTEDLTSMAAGNTMFMVGAIGHGEEYRDTTVTCGILPMPKYNEAQEDYASGMWTFSTFMTIPSNVTADRAKVVSAVFELMAAESYKQVTPVYYSKVIKGHYSSDEADAKMYDIAIRTCQYTFEAVFNSSLPTSLTRIWRSLNRDVQQVIDANMSSAWPAALEQLLASFEAMS